MNKEDCSWCLTEVNYLTKYWGVDWYTYGCPEVEICDHNFHYIHTTFHLNGSLYTDVEKFLPLAIVLS